MRRVLAVVMVVLAPWGAAAQEGPAIEGLIRDQFAAFARGDAVQAWGYASPLIQKLFGTPDNFGRMVQGRYPMIWAARDVAFLGARSEGGKTLERVRVEAPDGRHYLFDYEMVEVDGVWRINGVWPVQDDSVGA